MIKKILMLLLLFPWSIWAATAHLTHIQVASTESSAWLTFSLTKNPTFKIFRLSHPERLVLDFPSTQLGTNLHTLKWKNRWLQSIRSGHPNQTTLRLVIDLTKPFRYQVERHEKKMRLTIMTTSSPHITSSIYSSPTVKPFIVVIDPGHGGKDPGTTGPRGIKEKEVVLKIAKQLAKLINQEPAMRAVLTRNSDYFVSLKERLKLARRNKADLFIAIHADSFFNAHASGASVYALSQRGATSLAARWLADRENHSELDSVNLSELEDKSLMVRSVLIDLAQTATVIDSLRLGSSMLDALEAVTNLHCNRVEQAPFMVLKSPDIPSILVEVGFLSNGYEEKKLCDACYQMMVAKSLFQGIRFYLKKYSTQHVL